MTNANQPPGGADVDDGTDRRHEPSEASADPRALYQRLILDHSARPRNAALPETPTARRKGHNPLCGDRVTLAFRVHATCRPVRIEAIGCTARGCAISVAAASMMTEAVQGLSFDQIRELAGRVDALVHGRSSGGLDANDLGDLSVLAAIARFPMRADCATLPWQTLIAALDDDLDDGGTGTASQNE